MSIVCVLLALLAVAHSQHVDPRACVDPTPGEYSTVLEVGRNKSNDICVQEYTFIGKTDRLLDYTDTLDVTQYEKGDEEYRITKIRVIKGKTNETSSPIKSSIVSGGIASPTVTLRFIIAPGDFVLRVHLHMRRYVDRCCRRCESNNVLD